VKEIPSAPAFAVARTIHSEMGSATVPVAAAGVSPTASSLPASTDFGQRPKTAGETPVLPKINRIVTAWPAGDDGG